MPSAANHSTAPLVLFVESIRWLNVRWGMSRVREGLRRGGFAGRFQYWPWHATWRGMLVLPTIMDRRLLEREARRLAACVARRHRRRPARPIHLIGYSCGAYVALRAVELLPPEVRVESAVLLAAAFSPWRDLAPALSRIHGRLVAVSSVLDCLILGAGTTAFGTADRRHSPSAGMVGLRHPSARDERVVQIRWRPEMAALGWFGGHFTTPASALIATRVAPAMGIVPSPFGLVTSVTQAKTLDH